MSRRRRWLPLIVVAGVGALVLGGGQAESQSPATASIVASPTANVFNSADGGAPDVTIAAGGTVNFSYAGAATKRHNVNFTGAQPTSCTLTSGTTSTGPEPPLPNPATNTPWAGYCTFAAAGTYAFDCVIHGTAMSGSVTVVAPSPPPPPPPGAAPPPPPGAAPPPAVAPPPPAGAVPAPRGPAASKLTVATRQSGLAIRGTVKVRSAGSRLLARALGTRKALTGGTSTSEVEVGRASRTSAGPGIVAFKVALGASGQRALKRNGRLLIRLRMTIDPPAGTTYKASRLLVLHAS
jgi:plastocyanin